MCHLVANSVIAEEYWAIIIDSESESELKQNFMKNG